MMRKLAVTVFAMSLTVIGCGSSSTTKKDAAGDANVPKDTVVVVNQDTSPKIPDAGVIDTKVADTAVADVSAVDSAKSDATDDVITTTTSDAKDGSVVDTLVKLDVKLDVKSDVKSDVKLDTNRDTLVTIPDAPADTAPVSGDADIEVGGDAQAD